MDAPRKKPVRMLLRVGRLLIEPGRMDPLVTRSYDEISPGYDQAWTSHMRPLTSALLARLDSERIRDALDLTCGTGYATGLLAERTGACVIGVDRSAGMIAQARAGCPACEFVESDILDYLRRTPAASLDLVACCWGLGYSRPLAVLRQIRRVLRPGGRAAIIDNTLFSLREVLQCSALAFMERPQALRNLMKFRFLTGPLHLGVWFRLAGLKTTHLAGGSKTYHVASGREAIDRLHATGAAAGFEYACDEADRDAVYARFAEILERKYAADCRIPIVHRYVEGIAVK